MSRPATLVSAEGSALTTMSTGGGSIVTSASVSASG